MLLLIAAISFQVVAALFPLYFLVPVRFIAACIHFVECHIGYFFGASTKSLSIRGLNISYLVRKPRSTSTHHSPTIVLFHGATVNKYSWFSLIWFFPTSWRVLALDLPGHGDSEFRHTDKYSPYEVEAILHEFFCRIGLRRFHLIGQSLGSTYGVHYASVHPEMVESLTLISPPGLHRFGGKTSDCMNIVDNVKNLTDPSVPNLFLPQSGKDFRELMKVIFFRPRYIPTRILDGLVLLMVKKYPVFNKIFIDIADCSTETIRQTLENVSVPVQVIWGRHDNICHISGAEVVGKLIKNVKVTVIEDCGHVVTVEKPRVCSKLIIKHVESLTRNTNGCLSPSHIHKSSK